MNDHDLRDDELAAALRRRAAVPQGSTAAAHEQVVRRAGTIRRRRAAAAGSGAFALVVLGGILLIPRGGADEIGPLDSVDAPSSAETTGVTAPGREESEGVSPTVVAITIPDATAPSTAPSPEPSGAGAAAADDGTDDDVPSPGAEPTGSVAPTTAAAPATTPGPSSASPTSSSSSPTSSSPPATLAPFTETYRSAGSSITVSWNGSALSLLAVSPAPGFEPEIEDQSVQRIRVRFRSDDADTRIEVRVNHGRLVVNIG